MSDYIRLKEFLFEFEQNVGSIYTLSQQKKNKIIRVDEENIYVETEQSIAKFQSGKSETAEPIPKSWIQGSFEVLIDKKECSRDDLGRFDKRSSFIMAFLGSLPFTETNDTGGKAVIRLKSLTTADLPDGGFNESMKFLKGESASFKQKLLDVPFFKMVYDMLGHMKSFSVGEKRETLLEMMYVTVRSSTSTTPITESVAARRLSNTLRWLEQMDLIDENLNHIETSNIGPLMIEFMSNYLNARTETFSNHPIGHLMRKKLVSFVKRLSFIDLNTYIVKGSVGQGNWAKAPWLAIMHKDVTHTTQNGYYIVYLFSEDMKRVYLTIAQGVTETSEEEMEKTKKRLRQALSIDDVKEDNDFYLGESKLARDYVKSTIVYIPYSLKDFPDEQKLVSDLKKVLRCYERFVEFDQDLKQGEVTEEKYTTFQTDQQAIDHIHNYITGKGFFYKKEDVKNLYLCLKSKPFVILSGISGTGKTKIIQWFAESFGATEENGQFTLIPVRPDWSDSSDLLGYVDIKGDFVERPLTKVLREAQQHPDRPYFMLLDEMNLARVEYYFSDLLSVMESRKWKNGEMVTSAVLPEEMVGEKLTIPPNVYFAGTVNMDETTHPFSKKVLDRANTIEFSEVYLDHFSFIEGTEEVDSMMTSNEQLQGHYLHLKDAYFDHENLIKRVTMDLVTLNEFLEKIHAHFGYRVRDEVCFYIIYNDQANLMPYDQAFDYQLLQKVLPRISGSDIEVQEVLREMFHFCTGLDVADNEKVFKVDETARFPQSARKIQEMLRRLRVDGFTSFWLGS